MMLNKYHLILLAWALISPPVLADFTDPGPYEIIRRDFNVANELEPRRPIQARLTEPKTGPARSLVILLNGFGHTMDHYQDYANHLASYGVRVAAMNFLRNRNPLNGEHPYKAVQVEFLLKELEKILNVSEASLGLMGHSLGGKIAFMVALRNTQVKTVMALDPVNGGGPPCAIAPRQCQGHPVAPNPQSGQRGELENLLSSSLIMRSAPDRWLNPDSQFNAQWFFEGLDGQGDGAVPPLAVYFDLGERSHGAYVPRAGGSTVELVKRTSVAWFKQELEELDSEEYLTGEIIQRDIERGRLDRVKVRR